MTLDAAWLLAAFGAGALGAAALFGVALAAGSRRRGRQLAALEAQLAALATRVAAAAGIGARAGERLRRLDEATSQLNDRLGQLEIRGDGRPYDHAIALVRHGADADRLVTHFGLSRGEADLVTLVHGRSRAT